MLRDVAEVTEFEVDVDTARALAEDIRYIDVRGQNDYDMEDWQEAASDLLRVLRVRGWTITPPAV